MRIISWNINGLARHYEELRELPEGYHPDVICLQKVKSKEGVDGFPIDGYNPFWRDIDYGQYSGVATYYRRELDVHAIDTFRLSEGGHLQALDFPDFVLLNTYVPYSNKNISGAIARRKEWNKSYIRYVSALSHTKPIIICGDLNIVHKPIDAVDGINLKNSGNYYFWEHEDFETLLSDADLVDSLRALNPGSRIFSYFFQHKYKTDSQYGWRLDYFLVSRSLVPRIMVAGILDFGTSPSKPITLDLGL